MSGLCLASRISVTPAAVACPLCSGAGDPLFMQESIWIYACEGCGHQFAAVEPADDHVGEVYDDNYFLGGGAGYSDYFGQARLLRAHGRRYARILRRFMPAGEMLDVGAAAGFVLQGFVDEGWAGEGVEPNRQMSRFARRQLGLAVHTGTLEHFPRSKQYDLVSMIQVVAHFVDPREALQAAAELIRSGGLCLIETWDRESWTARLLGRRWHEYSPPSVLHWFSPNGLRRLLEEFGLEQIAAGRPRKWLSGGHAKSLLGYKLRLSGWGRGVSRALGLLPDRLPIPYPAEDLFWSLSKKR